MKFALYLCVAATALLAAGPAQAMIGGQTDGTDHPYVAAIGQPDGGGIVFTGTLVSPHVILTVAHGAVRLESATNSDQARVTFDPVADGSATWYTGTIHINPGYNPAAPGVGDLAVITFADALPPAPASLPSDGFFDQFPQPLLLTTPFYVVGYGLTGFLGASNGGGHPIPDFSSGGTRMADRELLASVQRTWLKFKLPAGDQLCPGDSGSPTLVGTSNLIAGVSLGSLGGCNSSGSATDMRVDTPSARAFIGQYVTLP